VVTRERVTGTGKVQGVIQGLYFRVHATFIDLDFISLLDCRLPILRRVFATET
jgi:hypothetical protein